MPLAQDDHVVQTLAPNGSDQSLCIREQHAAGEGWHGEEVHRHEHGDMIGQKGPPRLSRRATWSPQQSRHRPLRYRDAQLAQFTVDSGRSPERIRRGHRADEGSHGDIRVAAPWT